MKRSEDELRERIQRVLAYQREGGGAVVLPITPTRIGGLTERLLTQILADRKGGCS